MAKASLQPEMSCGFTAMSALLSFFAYIPAQKHPEGEFPFLGHNLPFTRLVGSKAGQDRMRSPRPRALNTPQLLPPALTSLFCYQMLLLTPFDKEMKSTALKTTLSFLLWEPALSIQTSMASQFKTLPALLLIHMPSAEQGHHDAQREP